MMKSYTFFPECDDVPAPLHGAVSYSNNRKTYQEVATFTCDIGYYLSYNEQMVCEGNGQWTGSVPECKIKGVVQLHVLLWVFSYYFTQ